MLPSHLSFTLLTSPFFFPVKASLAPSPNLFSPMTVLLLFAIVFSLPLSPLSSPLLHCPVDHSDLRGTVTGALARWTHRLSASHDIRQRGDIALHGRWWWAVLCCAVLCCALFCYVLLSYSTLSSIFTNFFLLFTPIFLRPHSSPSSLYHSIA